MTPERSNPLNDRTSAEPEYRVEPADEAPHIPGPERLWNESWYFDWVDQSNGLGLYLRVGLYPNLGQSWIHLGCTGEGGPLLLLADQQGPFAPNQGPQATAKDWSVHAHPEAELERWSVRFNGTVQRFTDPEAAYRRDNPTTTNLAFECVWSTRGEPYQYGSSTRYEISCTVAGWLAIDGVRTEISGTGQRDHSWGVRDWWSFDWFWSAATMQDGICFQATEIRLADFQAPFGYIQDANYQLTPCTQLTMTEILGEDGRPTQADLSINNGSVHLRVEPLVLTPVRFLAEDRAEATMHRALCRYWTPSGEIGHGWSEWNLGSEPKPGLGENSGGSSS